MYRPIIHRILDGLVLIGCTLMTILSNSFMSKTGKKTSVPETLGRNMRLQYSVN